MEVFGPITPGEVIAGFRRCDHDRSLLCSALLAGTTMTGAAVSAPGCHGHGGEQAAAGGGGRPVLRVDLLHGHGDPTLHFHLLKTHLQHTSALRQSGTVRGRRLRLEFPRLVRHADLAGGRRWGGGTSRRGATEKDARRSQGGLAWGDASRSRSSGSNRTGCSTVLVPASDVHALNMNLDNLGAQPRYPGGFILDHGSMAGRWLSTPRTSRRPSIAVCVDWVWITSTSTRYIGLTGYVICCWRDALNKLEGLQPNPIYSMAAVSEICCWRDALRI